MVHLLQITYTKILLFFGHYDIVLGTVINQMHYNRMVHDSYDKTYSFNVE